MSHKTRARIQTQARLAANSPLFPPHHTAPYVVEHLTKLPHWGRSASGRRTQVRLKWSQAQRSRTPGVWSALFACVVWHSALSYFDALYQVAETPGKSCLRHCLKSCLKRQSVGFTWSQNCGGFKRTLDSVRSPVLSPRLGISLAPASQAYQPISLSPSFLFNKIVALLYKYVLYMYIIIL